MIHELRHYEENLVFSFILEIGEDRKLNSSYVESAKEYDSELDTLDGLLSDVCKALSNFDNIIFHIEGFGQSPWPVDVYVDLCTFVEQLPDFVAWLTSNQEAVFDFDFYEQGIEITLHFIRRDNRVQITCQSRTDWQPSPQVEAISFNLLLSMTADFVLMFISEAEKVAPSTVSHDWFQEWKGRVVC